MTPTDAKRIAALGKKQGLKVQIRPDLVEQNGRIAIIDGFHYDDASAAASDILNMS